MMSIDIRGQLGVTRSSFWASQLPRTGVAPASDRYRDLKRQAQCEDRATVRRARALSRNLTGWRETSGLAVPLQWQGEAPVHLRAVMGVLSEEKLPYTVLTLTVRHGELCALRAKVR